MSTSPIPPALTPLQQTERQAMEGDQQAILRLVSALRGFRQLLEVIEAEGEVFFEHGQVCEEIESEGDEDWRR